MLLFPPASEGLSDGFELLPDELLDGEALLEALGRDEGEGPDSSWHAASAGIARARLSLPASGEPKRCVTVTAGT